MLSLFVKLCSSSNSHGVLYDESLSDVIKVRMGASHSSWSSLVPLPPPEEGPVIKHVLSLGVQCPEVSFPGASRISGHLDETIVERQVVSDGVLPLGELLLVVRKPLLYKLADPVESESPARGLDYGHGDESDVGVGRFALLSITGVLPVTVVLAVSWLHLQTHLFFDLMRWR